MRGWGVSDGLTTAHCVGEGREGFSSGILLAGHFTGRGLLSFTLRRSPGGTGRLGVCGGIFWPEVGVERGRGKH